MAPAGTDPLSDAAFAAAMAALGPFEARPRLAVAVSGGADSLALTLLAAGWAKAQGGRALGFTVDHGLRTASAAEAARVGEWLARRGIEHRVLPWTGPKPATGIQGAARAARYRLLVGACRENAILHLLLGHHLEDQAETLLARLGRGSGVDGLSAMAPVRELDGVRLLRPLLAIPRVRLRATLAAHGQEWVEDSSNHDPRHGRVRLRRLLPTLAAEGLTAERLAATAARLARARAALETEAARLAVAAIELDPGGFARLDPARLRAAPEEIALRTLAALVRCIGGGEYPPRMERLERLLGEIGQGKIGPGISSRRSFGHCLFLPRRDAILVCREPAALAPPVAVAAGDDGIWDGRFRFRIDGSGPVWNGGRVGALGASGWADLKRAGLRSTLPAALIHTFPALFDENGVSEVPRLGYKGNSVPEMAFFAFAPTHPLAGPGGGLVPTANGPISGSNDRAQRGSCAPPGGDETR